MTEPGSGDSVLAKVRMIVETFSGNSPELGLNELARRSGVAKASVHRLTTELVGWGVLEKVGGRYRLGARLYELGQLVPRNRILRDAALPFMEDLFLTTRESVYLGVRGDLELFQVERFLGPRGVSSARVPNRSPLHSSASGKALLAFSEPDVLARVLERGLAPRTKFTITDPERLRAVVHAVREAGYASECEEQTRGYGAVAAPVFAREGTLVGALSVVAPADRFDPHRLAPAVLTASRALARMLHASGSTIAAPTGGPLTGP